MINRVSSFNGDAREATAIIERLIADARHAIRNRDTREATATGERLNADARHTIRNRDARETDAKGERLIADARHATANRDARETDATIERILTNARHAVFDDNCFDAISVAVPRHYLIIKIHHLPRAADRQHSCFGIERPRQVIPIRTTSTAIGLCRRRQSRNHDRSGDED